MVEFDRIMVILRGVLLLVSALLLSSCGDGSGARQGEGGGDQVTYFHTEGMPFSEAVQVGDLLILAGQLGLDPETQQLKPGGIAAQTQQTMDNIGRTLAAQGLGFEQVVKCTVMLENMSEWQAFNEVYVTYFDRKRLPARSAFGADGLALGALVEVECWAVVGHPR